MTTKPVMAVCGLVIRPPYGHRHPGVAQHIEQCIAPQTDTRLHHRLGPALTLGVAPLALEVRLSAQPLDEPLREDLPEGFLTTRTP